MVSKHFCKICGSSTRIIEDVKRCCAYDWCDACEFIALQDAYVLSSDEEKKRYDNHQNTPANTGYVQMLQHFLEQSVYPYHADMKCVLEFGCGPGPVLAAILAAKGYTVDVFDVYYASVAVYEGKKYDVITATEVIEHVRDPLALMRCLRDHMDENGLLAVMTHFHANDPAVFLKWWYHIDDTHISFFTKKTMSVIADMLGMDMVFCNDKNMCTLKIRRAGEAR